MQRPLPAIYFCAIAALVGLLVGCATPPPASDPESLAEYRATNDPADIATARKVSPARPVAHHSGA